MRMLKRWCCLLITLALVGLVGMCVAYVRSPRYRAAQAYARIHEGITSDEADRIIQEFGGTAPFRVGMDIWDKRYVFGNSCHVGVDLQPNSPRDGPQVVTAKFLSRPTFTEWLSDWFESIQSRDSSYSSDANERMQEMLNESENLRAVSDEWKRFWEIEQPNRLSGSKE